MNTSINIALSSGAGVNGTKCSCGTADALSKANFKIENLENKIKLLIEENKVSIIIH